MKAKPKKMEQLGKKVNQKKVSELTPKKRSK
jgi:hypothetical protein